MTQSASHLREVPFDPSLHDFEMANDGADWAIFSRDRTRRYALGRGLYPGLFHARRHDDAPTAIVVGLNPSKAGAAVGDLTITKTCEFATRLGCKTLWMLNLYPWISTDPAGLERAADPIGEGTDAYVASLVDLVRDQPTLTIAAWGSHPMATAVRIDQVVAMLPRPIFCLGTTQDGAPRHPSRLAYSTPLSIWKA